MVTMARAAIAAADRGSHPHTGLVLDRLLDQWPEDQTQKGAAFVRFIANACKLPVPEVYQAAYQRWYELILQACTRREAALWAGQVEGRLFIGTGGVSPLEAAVTLHHTYGTPFIPGSALKGLTRAYALERIEGSKRRVNARTFDTLFGREPETTDGDWDGGEAGYLIFNNAWWIPHSARTPLTPEIVTVHHADYYSSQGTTPATDFDSPTPNAQIAVQGSFLFSIEGAGQWAEFGMELLQMALQHWGAGAKTGAGYGYFREDDKTQREIQARRDQAERSAREIGMTENQKTIQTFIDCCQKRMAELKGKKDKQNTGIHQQASKLVKDAAGWSSEEKQALADAIREWLPQVVDLVNKEKETFKKMGISALEQP